MHKFADFATLRRFVLAGDAIVTVRSKRTGTRFTFRFQRKKPSKAVPGTRLPIWVKVLTGPDNESSYTFAGTVWEEKDSTLSYVHSSKSKIRDPDAESIKALKWLLGSIVLNNAAFWEKTEVFHEGRCGRCGRRLTVPESIQSGIGPECERMTA